MVTNGQYDITGKPTSLDGTKGGEALCEREGADNNKSLPNYRKSSPDWAMLHEVIR